ncbi:hypothetical protein PVL29_003570 [Vitis rotundifolia]|uniref:Uncharacterized protein n=1 Tax=Vitis rotundifolia TaxID=103349 RepID=A0AA39ADF2_VITRO|nr:hypothetical protein PVL29_003570 [Vitis rotundifolia]
MSIVQWLLQISLLLWLSIGAAAATQGKPGCQKRCGDVDIPYPFGIGSARCYVDEWFEVTCNNSVHAPKPFLKRINLEVLNVSLDHGTIRVNNPVLIYYNCPGKPSNYSKSWDGGPFSFSETYTRFTAVGCSALAYITKDDVVNGGCISFCNRGTTAATNGNCNGLECCQTQVPPGLQSFTANLESTSYNFSDPKPETCKYAFMVDHKWFSSKLSDRHAVKDKGYVPAVLDWRIYNATCESVGWNNTSTSNTSPSFCGTNAHCSVANQSSGVTCACDRGYAGNPYLPEGCQGTEPTYLLVIYSIFCIRIYLSRMQRLYLFY